MLLWCALYSMHFNILPVCVDICVPWAVRLRERKLWVIKYSKMTLGECLIPGLQEKHVSPLAPVSSLFYLTGSRLMTLTQPLSSSLTKTDQEINATRNRSPPHTQEKKKKLM